MEKLLARGFASCRIAGTGSGIGNTFGLGAMSKYDTRGVTARNPGYRSLPTDLDGLGLANGKSSSCRIAGNVAIKTSVASFPQADILQRSIQLVIGTHLIGFVVHPRIVAAIALEGVLQILFRRASPRLNNRGKIGAGAGLGHHAGTRTEHGQDQQCVSWIHHEYSYS